MGRRPKPYRIEPKPVAGDFLVSPTFPGFSIVRVGDGKAHTLAKRLPTNQTVF